MASPESWAVRCPSCRRAIRVRPADVDPPPAGTLAYDVEIAGRPETRRRVEMPWTPRETARLQRWLLWSTVLTLALVGVLLAAALLWPAETC
jgi:hypothetical protein